MHNGTRLININKEHHMAGNEMSPNTNKLSLSLDLRVIVALLVVAIVAMLLIWKPWSSAGTSGRTINVTGEATLKAEPDEYVFSPSYQFKNTDKATALAELTKKSDAVVAQLKKLGVDDSKIKSNSGGYDDYYPTSIDPDTRNVTYTLTLAVSVGNRQLAQKVQDYLVTTSPTGAVSPQVTFSAAKRKQLESQARDEATKDARSKAEQSAKNLGFKLGKVKEVSDGTGFGGVIPLGRAQDMATVEGSSGKQLSVQPGENELNYTVTVTYFVR